MDQREEAQMRHRIETILESEHPATVLSELLFSPGGLFSRMAQTETERQELVQTPLFRRAQVRLTEVQRREADALRRELEQIEAIIPTSSSSAPVESGT